MSAQSQLNQSAFAFLSQPPPQKKKPIIPLPATPLSPPPIVSGGRRRSNTISSIAAWAALVQPGTPAPCSPRRASITGRRRSSIAQLISPTAGSFFFVETPTITKDGAFPDLTSLGYSQVFIHLPRAEAPLSATILPPRAPGTAQRKPLTPLGIHDKENVSLHIPIPPIPVSPTATVNKPSRTLKHFRSLSILKRSRSKSVNTVAPKMPLSPHAQPTASSSSKSKTSSSAVAKKKKSKYPTPVRPPPLSNELLLAQFTAGGTIDSHVKRTMDKQAKAAAGYSREVSAANGVGVADVYRDGKGGIWWDQDEEWEYAHLLGTEEDQSDEWVKFGARSPAGLHAGEDSDDERRGSLSSLDSDLDPRYVVRPVAGDEQDDLAAFGGSSAMRKPGMSVLSIPSRPRRKEMHLRKDTAFPIAGSPSTTISPSDATATIKPRGKDRRRPAPLTLTPPVSATAKRPSAHHSQHQPQQHLSQIRRDFLESSFAPAPAPAAAAPFTPFTPFTPPPPSANSASTGRRSSIAAFNMSVLINKPTINPAANSTDALPLARTGLMGSTGKSRLMNVKGLFKSSASGR